MKKILIITTLFFLLAITCSAKNGDITGTIYSTDILATVNGTPVESFNIGGKTAIILEDLTKLGAEASYDNSLRTLLVNVIHINPNPVMAEVQRGTVGKVLGNLYKSDIVTYYNGIPLQTFSLNGRMAAVMEEIGGADYSAYGAKCAWDESAKTIALNCLLDNFAEARPILEEKKLTDITISKEIVSFTYNFINGVCGVRISESPYGFDREIIHPIYYSGKTGVYLEDYETNDSNNETNEQTQIGYRFPVHLKEFRKDENGKTVLSDDTLKTIVWFDIEKLPPIVETFPLLLHSYEEVLAKFLEPPIGVSEKFDTGDYTFLALIQFTPHGRYPMYVRIDKNGDCLDYTYDFPVDIKGGATRHLSNYKLDKEKEIVTFDHYDTHFLINLKTGIMQEFDNNSAAVES